MQNHNRVNKQFSRWTFDCVRVLNTSRKCAALVKSLCLPGDTLVFFLRHLIVTLLFPKKIPNRKEGFIVHINQ